MKNNLDKFDSFPWWFNLYLKFTNDSDLDEIIGLDQYIKEKEAIKPIIPPYVLVPEKILSISEKLSQEDIIKLFGRIAKYSSTLDKSSVKKRGTNSTGPR